MKRAFFGLSLLTSPYNIYLLGYCLPYVTMVQWLDCLPLLLLSDGNLIGSRQNQWTYLAVLLSLNCP